MSSSVPIRGSLPANSNRKPVERVTSKPAIVKDRTIQQKARDAFLGDDVKSVGDFLVWDVVVPAVKNTISDMVTTGVNRLLFGENRTPLSTARTDHTSYSRVYRDRGDSSSRNRGFVKPVGQYDFSRIVIQSRTEAEEVLNNLDRTIEEYDFAAVSDFYDYVGVSKEYTDDRWGWRDLRGASIMRVAEGYVINLPRPESL